MEQNKLKPELNKGSIAWMASNRVTPNIIMLILLIGGLYFAAKIKQEVFPEFSLDMVQIMVPYPGASPEEVEQGIILAIEEGIRGLDGIKEISAVANEGMGMVTAELLEGVDTQRVYQDIKQEIDRIVTFPLDAEEPEVSLIIRKRQVLQIQIYGDVSEMVLRELAEQVRDNLLNDPGITQVELDGARDYEIHVQIDRETLRRYNLTLAEVSDRIRQTAIELPGGYIETAGGDLLLRMKDRRDWAYQFARMPIITTEDGTLLYLDDIAQVTEGFKDVDQAAWFDGKRAIGVSVFRVGRQTPIGVSKAGRKAMESIEAILPEGVNWTISDDNSEIYRQRLELLLKNAAMGLSLVFILLALFLELKLAFWVMMGIPISFLGSFLFLNGMDVTINMVSMFAFIIALGIVVDDAIVVGENIYEYRNRGMSYLEASIRGARDVSGPVVFSILTNIVAFLPLCFIPGIMGKIWIVIPAVVITVFSISLIESLYILPAHLSHYKEPRPGSLNEMIHRAQQAFSRQFERFIRNVFGPFLDFCIRHRQITMAIALATLIFFVSWVLSGRVGLIMMPRVEADKSAVTAVLPYGSPISRVEEVARYLTQVGEELVKDNGDDRLSTGIYSSINENKIDIQMFLTVPSVRPLTTAKVTDLWRQKAGQIPGLESIRFESDRGGPGSGAAISIELSHRNIDTLDRASAALADRLEDFPNVKDIDDGYTPGKSQIDFKIKPEGQSLGLTSSSIARQVRNSFYGAEALRQQRGRNEIRVRVKLPDEQRQSEYDVENLLIRTPAGRDVPLMQVAEVTRGRAYTTISRRNSRRTVMVTANIDPIEDTEKVKEKLSDEILPELLSHFPGLTYAWEGRQADFGESMSSLKMGFVLAILAIYALLAIPFKSYSQPLIIMVAIPFGVVGAIIGHMIMGYAISLLSLMGIIALTGVVVNDSLVLIDCANNLRRDEGLGAFDAIHQAGVRRFRPIMLTTLTTFGGLAPMIFENSRQAKFLIPMALSLGYGILFSTVITLIVVPCLYISLHETGVFFKKIHDWMHPASEPVVPEMASTGFEALTDPD